ncbi:MAG: hypothetical protein KAY50_00445 [Chitinophagaceae bacterium]|nr:hypothetical protein [Chitinophagaceae bacterium]
MKELNRVIINTVVDLLELNGWKRGTSSSKENTFFKDCRQVNVTEQGVALFIDHKHTYHVALINVLDDGMTRYFIKCGY